ncbi:MAG: hypothetical protein GY883_13860 [Shimia sp.]|nr:hypothetical protein [Shimia sp.]
MLGNHNTSDASFVLIEAPSVVQNTKGTEAWALQTELQNKSFEIGSSIAEAAESFYQECVGSFFSSETSGETSRGSKRLSHYWSENYGHFFLYELEGDKSRSVPHRVTVKVDRAQNGTATRSPGPMIRAVAGWPINVDKLVVFAD